MRWLPKWLRFGLLAVVAVPLLPPVAGVAAYATDQLVHHGQVVRNVTLAGERIGGLGEGDLRRKVELVAARHLLTPVEVRLDGAAITGIAADFGIEVDVEATMAAALKVGREQSFADRFQSWARSLRRPHKAPVIYSYDDAAVYETVAESPHTIDALPVEPSFVAVEGILDVQPLVYGRRLDPADVVAALPAAVAAAGEAIVAEVPWTPIPTEVTQEELDAALAEAEAMTSERLWVDVAGQATSIAPETARRWLVSLNTGGELIPMFDEAAVHESLETFTADLTTRGSPPTFAVVDNELQVEIGTPSMRCCDAGVGDLMWRAARGLIDQPVELPLRLTHPGGAIEEAAAYGITELVSEFTTNHACCQNRVRNIQRMADIVRGVIIEPGETFSINEYVGRRTRDKGFVAAGAIENGHFVDDVGGGVSQFATTMFNAAFFAGMDFEEYQAHTIYISRYPYGREATLSFPKPDLIVTNPTPYAMMLWTSYTPSSITVQVWSTKYFEVEQTGQARYPVGACRGAETFRQRVAPDGQVFEDSVIATYRPGEGRDCAGRATTKPRR